MYKELTKEQYEHRIKQLENVCETVLAYTTEPSISERDRLALQQILGKAIFINSVSEQSTDVVNNLSTNIFHDKRRTDPINLDHYKVNTFGDIRLRDGVFYTYDLEALKIFADKDSTVHAFDGSIVIADKGSVTYAYSGSSINAQQGSIVDAFAGSRVNAWNGSMIRAWEGSEISAYPGATIFVDKGSQVNARKDVKFISSFHAINNVF
jgi:hypothetical protein